MATETTFPETLQEAVRYFTDPDVCLMAAVALRWGNGPIACPTCGSTEVSFIATRRLWRCKTKHAQQQFSVKVGTIMEDSPLGLDKWMVGIWLIAAAKNGISSYELHRAIGITQKSAWFMLHRIRLAMQAGSFAKIGGEIEVDETFIGGKARNMHTAKRKRVITGTGGSGKVAVQGLLQRHSKGGHSTVRVGVVGDRRKATLQGTVHDNVRKGATVYTDELLSYDGLNADYVHNVINHAEAYVEGNVHTNGMENFWSLLKRTLNGTYVSVEPFHLFRYLDEQAFRFNNRKMTDSERFTAVASAVAGKRLTYKALIGANLSESREN
jgi:transposase-like protein